MGDRLIAKRLLIIAVAVATMGLVVTGILYLRQRQDHRLIDDRLAMIEKAKASSASGNSTYPQTTKPIPPSSAQGAYGIQTVLQDGTPKEIRYYHENELIAVDVLDAAGRVVRRDFRADQKTRAQLFFDPDGRVITTKFFESDGSERIERPFFPPILMRPGY